MDFWASPVHHTPAGVKQRERAPAITFDDAVIAAYDQPDYAQAFQVITAAQRQSRLGGAAKKHGSSNK